MPASIKTDQEDYNDMLTTFQCESFYDGRTVSGGDITYYIINSDDDTVVLSFEYSRNKPKFLRNIKTNPLINPTSEQLSDLNLILTYVSEAGIFNYAGDTIFWSVSGVVSDVTVYLDMADLIYDADDIAQEFDYHKPLSDAAYNFVSTTSIDSLLESSADMMEKIIQAPTELLEELGRTYFPYVAMVSQYDAASESVYKNTTCHLYRDIQSDHNGCDICLTVECGAVAYAYVLTNDCSMPGILENTNILSIKEAWDDENSVHEDIINVLKVLSVLGYVMLRDTILGIKTRNGLELVKL